MEYSAKIIEIGDRIANLTILDARELSDYLKEEHGIVATASAPSRLQQTFDPKPVEEARTHFKIMLEGFAAAQKISVIKVVRQETGLGLKEAKDLVERAPTMLKDEVEKGEAERIVAELTKAGAEAKLV